MLHKIGLKKSSNGTWVCKAEGDSIGEVGPSGTTREDITAAVENFAMVPYNPPMDRGEPLSRFEQMVLGRLDHIFGEQKMHHEYCAARFQLLHSDIEHVQDQLDSMNFRNED